MDVYCPRCGEPWDIDTFHDAADEQGASFDDIRRRFYSGEGCAAIGWGSCNVDPDSNRAQVSALAHDLMGDDIDGIASMLDDADFLGLL